MQGAAVAFKGRGEDLSVAIASLDGFAEQADRILRILDSQSLATQQLVRSGGDVFQALSERQGQLAGLVRNTQAVFSTTAQRNADLKQLFIVLPTFLRESRTTLTRLDQFAGTATPVLSDLRPAAKQLGPTLGTTANLAVELNALWPGLRDAINAAPKGFPALRRLLDDDLPPLLTRLPPFLDELTPIIQVVGDYRHEVTGFLGNVTASTNAKNDEGNGPRNYLRTIPAFNPEMLSAYPQRLRSNRNNPYIQPKGYLKLKSGLQSFQTVQCGSGINSILDANAAANPDFNSHTDDDPLLAQDLLNRIKTFVFTEQQQSNDIPQAPCRKQPNQASIGGAFKEFTDYLHVRALR